MAWALELPVVGISSLQTVAMNALGFSGGIVPLFDARRGQVYTGLYRSEQVVTVRNELPDRIMLLTDWLMELKEEVGDESLLFMGEDLRIHQPVIQDTLGNQAIFPAPTLSHPRAAQTGWLALQEFMQGKGTDAHELVPDYLQVAEAEAKWLAKQQK